MIKIETKSIIKVAAALYKLSGEYIKPLKEDDKTEEKVNP